MGLCGQRSKFYEELVERLITFAEFEFKNARRLDDGGTEGDHKASAAKQWEKLGKKKQAEYVVDGPPSFPSELSYLWRWFCQHALGLAINGMAPSVVTWEGVTAWAALMDVRLEPWEALTMVRLGHLRAGIETEKISAASKAK